MRAAVCPRYGSPDVIELREVPTPVPGPHEIRIRARAASVQSGDWRVRSGKFPYGFGFVGRLALGWSGPRQPILGTELAGDVDAVGAAVTKFKVGDAVFAFTDTAMGCHAEYRCIAESGQVVHKPAKLSYEEAATLSFGGTTALDVLARGGVKSGEEVLVNGASGSVGTATVQLAKRLGARVTAVCSAGNAELVRSLGADRVIDYAKEDFTTERGRWDAIVDTVGNAPFGKSKHALKADGRLLVVLGTLPAMLGAPLAGLTSRRRVVSGQTRVNVAQLHELASISTSGAYRTVVDRQFPFEQIADAYRHVDAGHKRGNVVISFAA